MRPALRIKDSPETANMYGWCSRNVQLFVIFVVVVVEKRGGIRRVAGSFRTNGDHVR